MRYEESGGGYSNIVQWDYDDENNLSSQTQTLNGTTYTSTYAYDKDNRLTKATEGAISANYTYDSFSRMTGLTATESLLPQKCLIYKTGITAYLSYI